jgi:hypothetical protein
MKNRIHFFNETAGFGINIRERFQVALSLTDLLFGAGLFFGEELP